jgi:hypothetical protein
MRRAIGALGVATGKEAAHYYRLDSPIYRFANGDWRGALKDLEQTGDVVRVRVEGWPSPGYALPAALEGSLSAPKHRPVFLSPFDNLIWERDRTERLFGFYYRIEIYVPEAKRHYGYYVLPLLSDGSMTGRADLKLDREARVLRVRAMYLEGAGIEEAASALGDLAAHLGAERVEVERTEPARALRGLRKLVQESVAGS